MNDFPGRLFKQMHSALTSAFRDRDELRMIVRTELDANLETIAGAGTYSDAIFDLIRWAESTDRIADLVTKARVANATNPELIKFETRFNQWLEQGDEALSAPSQPTMSPPPGAMRSADDSIQTFVPTEQVFQWSKGMHKASRALCMIETERGGGTGFLIGRRLVLTAYHVVSQYISSDDSPDVGEDDDEKEKSTLRVRFDYFYEDDGETPQDGVVYELDDYWLVEEDPQKNYALLLVKGSPGTDRLPKSSVKRGWLKLGSEQPTQVNDALFVMAYDSSLPLRVGYATPAFDFSPEHRFVAYWYDERTVRHPGSSGAPIFNAQWEVVGFHMMLLSSPANWPKGNVGEMSTSFSEQVSKILPTHDGGWLRVGCNIEYILRHPRVKMALALSNG